jgi:hypothetical protein
MPRRSEGKSATAVIPQQRILGYLSPAVGGSDWGSLKDRILACSVRKSREQSFLNSQEVPRQVTQPSADDYTYCLGKRAGVCQVHKGAE